MQIHNLAPASNPYQSTVQSPWQQRAQDFKAIGASLQAGDLSAAKLAFSAFQKDQQTLTQATNGAAAPTPQVATAMQALQTALGSANLSGAQQAFAEMKQAMQGNSQIAQHQHNQHPGGLGAASGSGLSGTQAAGSVLNMLA
jgi:hypothetical protein